MRARLTIDMPESCSCCRFIGLTMDYRLDCCLAHNEQKVFYSDEPENEETEFNHFENKPDWCPLEPFETVGDWLKSE